jgi:hypothetical protein
MEFQHHECPCKLFAIDTLGDRRTAARNTLEPRRTHTSTSSQLCNGLQSAAMWQGHVYDDVLGSCHMKILNPEVCLLQSAAMWHVLSFASVSRLVNNRCS